MYVQDEIIIVTLLRDRADASALLMSNLANRRVWLRNVVSKHEEGKNGSG